MAFTITHGNAPVGVLADRSRRRLAGHRRIAPDMAGRLEEHFQVSTCEV